MNPEVILAGDTAETSTAREPVARPTLQDIYDARQRIAGVVRRTPLEHSPWLSRLAGCDVFLKLECWQRTRSFKMRGAYNAISALDPAARARGLVTASAGNHGQAVALAARELGARATIFLPANAPQTKQARIKSYGATLRTEAATYDDAEVAAQDYARQTDATFVHAFSDAAVVAGQGTVGLEILEDLPNVREVLAPVGGGGLIAGLGIVLKSANPEVRVLGVQSDQTPAMHMAFAAGRVVDAPIPPTLADGLAGCTDELGYQRARRVVDQLKLVPEAALASAIRSLYRHDGIVVEGAAAVVVAALVEGTFKLSGPAVLVLSGGTIDGALLSSILSGDV